MLHSGSCYYSTNAAFFCQEPGARNNELVATSRFYKHGKPGGNTEATEKQLEFPLHQAFAGK